MTEDYQPQESIPRRLEDQGVFDHVTGRGRRFSAIALTAATLFGASQLAHTSSEKSYQVPIEATLHTDELPLPTELNDVATHEHESQMPLIDVEGVYSNADVDVRFDSPYGPSFDVEEKVAGQIIQEVQTSKYLTIDYLTSKYGIDEVALKGVLEQRNVQDMLAFTNAKHILSVELKKSGMKFNFFKESVTNGDELMVSIDPRAVATVFEVLMSSLSAPGETYLSPEQTATLQEKAQHGGFANKTINVILSADVDACLDNVTNRNPYNTEYEKCSVGGYAYSQMFAKSPTRMDFSSNPLILMAGPNPYAGDPNKNLAQTFIHESAHLMADLAGKTFHERTARRGAAGNNDPYAVEHAILTRLAQQTLTQNAGKLGKGISSLEPIRYMPIKASVDHIPEPISRMNRLQTEANELAQKIAGDEPFDVEVLEGVRIYNADMADPIKTENPIVLLRPGTNRQISDPERYVFAMLTVNSYKQSIGAQKGGPSMNMFAEYPMPSSHDAFVPAFKQGAKGGPSEYMPIRVTIPGRQDVSKGIIGYTKDGRMIKIGVNYNEIDPNNSLK